MASDYGQYRRRVLRWNDTRSNFAPGNDRIMLASRTEIVVAIFSSVGIKLDQRSQRFTNAEARKSDRPNRMGRADLLGLLSHRAEVEFDFVLGLLDWWYSRRLPGFGRRQKNQAVEQERCTFDNHREIPRKSIRHNKPKSAVQRLDERIQFKVFSEHAAAGHGSTPYRPDWVVLACRDGQRSL